MDELDRKVGVESTQTTRVPERCENEADKVGEQKFDNLLSLLGIIANKLDLMTPQPQVQPQITTQHQNQSLDHAQGESSARAHFMEPRNEKSVPYTHSPLPKPSKPLFEQPQESEPQDFEGEVRDLFLKYQAQEADFKEVSFESYLNIFGKKNRKHKHDDKRKLQHKIQVPMFSGKGISVRAWLPKLQTYFSICPMTEEDAVKFAIMQLEDSAYDWWYHGLITLGHSEVATFDEFTQRVLDRFERKDEEYFRDLATLRQRATVEAYVDVFVMVPNISDKRITFLFIEGLLEPLKGLVRAFEPPNLQSAIRRALSLESSAPPRPKFSAAPPYKSSMAGPPQAFQRPNNFQPRNQPYASRNQPPNQRPPMPTSQERDDRDELRRKKLCFSCKNPWVPGHRCQDGHRNCRSAKALVKGMAYVELEAWVQLLGYRASQALMLWKCLYGNGTWAQHVDELQGLSKHFREALRKTAEFSVLSLKDVYFSVDGTCKILFSLGDGLVIETVVIPCKRGRTTVCVSSQVGCAMNCQFCYTGRMGLKKNLTAAEMVEQVVYSRRLLSGEVGPITNVVFMGMGEPLDNFDNVMKAIEIMVDCHGLYFSPRKVTVSTSGLVPQVRRFIQESPCELAVSLNATTDEIRNWIMPINRKYNLDVLLTTLREEIIQRPKYKVLFEYVMLAGINDSIEDAKRLVYLIEGIPCKINLISFNPHKGSPFSPSSQEQMLAFRNIVANAGCIVFIRYSRGEDQMAACGQLGHPGNSQLPLMQIPERFQAVIAS